MAAAAAPPIPSNSGASSRPDRFPRPQGLAISWDSQVLCKRAESCELESEALSVNPTLLPTLEDLLIEIYAMLRPKPDDYEQRHLMVNVFNKIAEEIFGKKKGFPVVEAFGSFTMDLFTTKSDLDLSINFNADFDSQFARKDKISVIRRLAKVLHSHQRNGRCHGVLPVVTAIVPVLKVIDKGTGVECDISVENKDGMSRSMIFRLISSIDERFQILCYLMKFWAKAHDVNCPRDRTMSSMAIISLVAFHLQTRRPPILPAFSVLLKDGPDFSSIQRNVSLFEGFGSRNKESVAELFVSLMSKLLSVEGLWEQGLCASNFEGSWTFKTWDRGIGNLSVEDFLDRSQNFARAVGKMEMQRICECIRLTVLNLNNFFKGKIEAPKLKTLLFEPPHRDELISNPSLKLGKRKRDSTHGPEKTQKKHKKGKDIGPENSQKKQKKVKHIAPENNQNQQKKVKHVGPENNQKQQKKVKHTVNLGHAASKPTTESHRTFVPKPQVRPVEPINQLAHMPAHLVAPSFAYGLTPQPHLHSSPHSSQQLLGQLQGNFIHYPGIQLQQQLQLMFVPLPPPQPVIPYDFHLAQQIQHNENRVVQRMPYYGAHPYYRR
uniref:Poly(A) RNA polymerase mitochondrial-like central palm domain-containing protein n=1 Tax=Leersia perrieri TaxID=77586 RepID=A0A0D9XAW8_9ORYZ